MPNDESDRRIWNLDHLSPEDWRTFLRELLSSSEDDRRTAFLVRINFDFVNALHQMDRTSTALSKRLVWLTWVLVIMTAILLIDPGVRLYEFISAHLH
jgi:hypothetical protein